MFYLNCVLWGVFLPRLIKKVSKSKGLTPDSLSHIGEKKTDKVRISIIDYDEKKVEEIEESYENKLKEKNNIILKKCSKD